jgi:hypothetical protein
LEETAFWAASGSRTPTMEPAAPLGFVTAFEEPSPTSARPGEGVPGAEAGCRAVSGTMAKASGMRLRRRPPPALLPVQC